MSTPVSIVVAYASVGSGYRLAAEAVARELRETGGEAVSVELLDASEGCPDWVVRIVDGRLAASRTGRAAIGAMMGAISLAAGAFTDRLLALQPSLVICTHPLPTAIAAHLTLHRRIRSRVVSAPTDFDVPGVTPRHGVALHCVASERCAEQLLERLIPAASIAITGIPVRPQFTVEYDTSAARTHFDLPHERRIVLAIAGSSSPEPYAKLKEALAISLPALASLPDTSLVIVSGHDNAFCTEISSRSKGFGTTNVRVFEYVEHMAPLIACADLVIAKAAGLVCAECLDMGAPLVLAGPVQGHERANAHALVDAKAAVFAEDPSMLSDHVRKVIASPKRLARMREASAALARPFAAGQVAGRALALVGIEGPGDLPGDGR